jgi:pentatricopeptide repeat protein
MQWIVESLVKRKVRADPATSAIALRRRAPFVNDPSTLWNDLQTNVIDLGMMPSIYHITAIQQAYLEVGDIQGIRDAMRRAKEMGVPMCPAFFNILMNAHIRKYQIRQAYEVYGSMKTVGVEPNFHCVALMAHGWAKIGEVGKVEELVNLAEERFRQSEPFPNPSLVACLYRAYWESGDDLGAQKMLRKALVKGLRPDGHVFTLMMRRTRTYLARKRARRAELGSSSTPLPPTSDAHNTRHVTPSDAEHTHRLVLTQRLQRRNELILRRRNDYHRVEDERAREMLRVIIKHWPRKGRK